MRVKVTSTGQTGWVVRGPYRKFNQEWWYDVILPNDLGEPGRYTHRYRIDQCVPIEEE